MLEHEDMNLSTREVARLLDMPEETIQSVLPNSMVIVGPNYLGS